MQSSPPSRRSPSRALRLSLCATWLGLAAPLLQAQANPAATPAPAAASPAAPAAPRFDVLEFEIDGNTRLSVREVEAAVLPFLGEQRDMSAVEGARAALEKAYQAAGYLTVFVDVPEQRVDSGVVRLQVLEGRIGHLQVSGARYFSQGRIRAVVSELAEGQVPNFNEVQQQLAQLNRNPDRRVTPVLKPGVMPGTVQAELKVDDELPASGSIELSNANAAGTVPFRLALNARYANLLQREHELSLTLLTAPEAPKQSQVAVLGYTMPLGEGEGLSFSWINSRSDLDTLGGTTVLGRGSTWGLRHQTNRVLEASAHSLSVGLDIKDLDENIVTSAGTVALPLRYAPLQLAYNGSSWGQGLNQQWQLSAAFGLSPLLRAERDDCQRADGSFGPADQFACKRRGATGGFSALRADWRLTQRLGPTEVALRLGGQLASQQLVSAEQFSLGGAETVRGYYEGSASGDHGLLASLELRTRNLAPWMVSLLDDPAEGKHLGELTLFAFVDAGRVSLIDPEPGQARRTPLLGHGFGLRLALKPGFSFALDWAQRHKELSGRDSPRERIHVRAGLRL